MNIRFAGQLLTLIVLVGIHLAGCGPVPEVWVERLEVEVNEDLSGQVRLVVLESNRSIDQRKSEGMTPVIDTLFTEGIASCIDVRKQPYLVQEDAQGYRASVDFSTYGELEDALSCIPFLAQWVIFAPLQVNEDLLGVDYELRIELLVPELVRELRVGLPGRVDGQALNVPSTIQVSQTVVSDKTVVWEINTLEPTQLTATSESVGMQAPAESQTGDMDGNTLVLLARGHKSFFRIEWIFSIVGALLGSGLLWRLVDARKKRGQA